MKRQSALLAFLLKAAIGLGLLSIFLSRLDLGQFVQALTSARFSYVVLALFLYLVGKLVTAVRWALLARPLGFANPLKDFVAFYYIGMFFNLFAPSTLGGDAGRIFYLSRGSPETAERGRAEAAALALASILADRGMGMAVLVWIGAGALVVFPEYALLVPGAARYVTFTLAIGPIAAWALFPFCHRLLRKIDHPLGKKLEALGSAYWERQGVLLQALGLSLAFHLMQIWIQIVVGQALGFNIPWPYAFVFFPLVDIVSMLPVTLSGIGLREGGYLFFLGKLGISPEKAVACATLWLVVVVVSGLVGALAFVFYRGSAALPFGEARARSGETGAERSAGEPG